MGGTPPQMIRWPVNAPSQEGHILTLPPDQELA